MGAGTTEPEMEDGIPSLALRQSAGSLGSTGFVHGEKTSFNLNPLRGIGPRVLYDHLLRP